MDDIAFSSATDLTAALRSKRISSLELLDLYLDRVERLNPAINAVVTLGADRARGEARAADDRAARGDFTGPLHGLPMTIKDSVETAGMRTTSGAPMLAEHVPQRDADSVARLRGAGAIVFGKTNLPIFAGDGQTFNDVFGTTNNPWDLTRTPGGSSGGAAAAIAAGLAPLELGSDIAGSIRNPAHYCGVYGHKPTHGIVPNRGHIPGAPGELALADLGVVGPIARSADDLDLALDVLAGANPDDAIAWKLALPPPRRGSLREYRFAAWLDDPEAPVDAAVTKRLQATVDALRSAGAQVDEQARPAFSLGQMQRVFERLLFGVIVGGMPDEPFEALIEAAKGLSADDETFAARFIRASTQRKREWNAANEARAQMRAAWAAFFRDYDVLLCPAAPTAAFAHDHTPPHLGIRMTLVNDAPRPVDEAIVWAGFVSAALLPATVAPVGRTRAGLPVGVQIVGPYLEDRTTIDVARRLADVIGGYERPPGFD